MKNSAAFLRSQVTNGDERRSDPVPFDIVLHISAVIPQRIRRNQFVQGRVLLRLGRILFPGENQPVFAPTGTGCVQGSSLA